MRINCNVFVQDSGQHIQDVAQLVEIRKYEGELQTKALVEFCDTGREIEVYLSQCFPCKCLKWLNGGANYTILPYDVVIDSLTVLPAPKPKPYHFKES